ncbi:MAG: inorganic phosphate transporter [Candidatus Syntropharchaeia archaeon]
MDNVLLALAFGAAFYMAWNIGANDLANSMGDVVGARVLDLKRVIIFAGIMDFAGVILCGSRVTKTVAKGIVPLSAINNDFVIYGALAALIGTGIWITIATYLRLPISTSHSIVGGMLGFGLACAFFGEISLFQIKWITLLRIVASWIISPISGLILSFIIFRSIRKFLIERVEDVKKLENIFGFFLICSSCYVAFAHGSNDVANAIGPLSAALGLVGEELPFYILAFGGFGIVFGLATWGYRVIETIGKNITEITPSRGFSADLATATTVITCSYLGLPVSTTHTLVGAVIGIGLAGGLPINLSIVRKIIFSWVVTLPVAAGISAAIFVGLMAL